MMYHSSKIETCYNCSYRTLLKQLYAAQRPGVVRNLTRGPVSVSEDGSNVQLLQRISWQPPVSGEVMLYLIRYGMGVHNPEDASFNVTTTNTSIVLTLSVPEGPLNMVDCKIWVAVLTKSEEEGNATLLTVQCSSESELVVIGYCSTHVLLSNEHTY